MGRHSRSAASLLFAAVLSLALSAAEAEIPRTISFQARVDSAGVPLQGTHTVQVRLFDAESGGSVLWDSGQQTCSVSHGVLTLLLGDSGQPALTLQFEDPYYAEVSIDGITLNGRRPLTSVAYSFKAVHADSANSSALASMLRPGVEIIGSISSGTYAAVKATNTSATGQTYGFHGTSHSTTGRGVYGEATAATGTNYGVYGKTNSAAGYAGYFEGAARITGNLTVNGGVSGPSIGDIQGVTAGTGLNGGGTSGTVALNVTVPLTYTASNTNPIISGANTGAGPGVRGTTSSTAGGVWGTTSATTGRGVYGEATAATGTNYGVYGKTSSTSGYAGYFEGAARITGNLTVNGGVSGPSIGDIQGVTAGTGLNGGGTSGTVALNVTVPLTYTASNTNPIISGANTGTGPGVKGTTSSTAGGVWGTTSATTGRGVYGEATATTGTNYGVYGTSVSTAGRGVFGESIATSGVVYGVYGSASSTAGTAVYGITSATSGYTYGVYGVAASTSGRGVIGYAAASSGATYGVYGSANSPSGFGVYYSGGLSGSGSKNCVVRTSQGPTLLHCQESPEAWFEDFGLGQLTSGRARVDLDPLFLETVTIDDANPMLVFIQLMNNCNGTYVETGASGFEVFELNTGTSDASFAYRVVAKRKGYERSRLDFCEAALQDAFLYPELRQNTELHPER